MAGATETWVPAYAGTTLSLWGNTNAATIVIAEKGVSHFQVTLKVGFTLEGA